MYGEPLHNICTARVFTDSSNTEHALGSYLHVLCVHVSMYICTYVCVCMPACCFTLRFVFSMCMYVHTYTYTVGPNYCRTGS